MKGMCEPSVHPTTPGIPLLNQNMYDIYCCRVKEGQFRKRGPTCSIKISMIASNRAERTLLEIPNLEAQARIVHLCPSLYKTAHNICGNGMGW